MQLATPDAEAAALSAPVSTLEQYLLYSRQWKLIYYKIHAIVCLRNPPALNEAGVRMEGGIFLTHFFLQTMY